MAGESQKGPASPPDPTTLTTEQMLLAISNLEKLTESEREGHVSLVLEKITHLRHEMGLIEEHRKELKADSEKSRDRQTTAEQLAIDKAEAAFAEQLKQQKETFTLSIATVTTGLNEMKAMVGELRAERRGGRDTISSIYTFAGFLVSIVVLIGFYLATGR